MRFAQLFPASGAALLRGIQPDGTKDGEGHASECRDNSRDNSISSIAQYQSIARMVGLARLPLSCGGRARNYSTKYFRTT